MVNKNNIGQALDKLAEWSIYILILMLPISKSVIEIAIVAALACMILAKIIKKEIFEKISTTDIVIFIYIIAVLPSFFNSCDISLSVRAFFSKTIKFGIFALAVKEIIDTKTKFRNLLIVALLSAAIVAIDGFIQYFITHRDLLHFDGLKYAGYLSFQFSEATIMAIGNNPYPKGFPGFPTASFPFPNDLASWILVMVFPAAMFLIMKGQRLSNRIILGSMAISLGYLLVLTKTRSAWLGFAVSCIILPLFGLASIKKFVVMFLIIMILGAAIIVGGSMTQHIIAAAGIIDRQVMWGNAWNIFKEHPIIGCGLNTFFIRYMHVRNDESKDKRGSYAHNCYLQMVADTGLVGLISFLTMIFVILSNGFRSYKITKDPFWRSCIAGIILGVVAYLVQSFFDTNLYSLNLAALFWLSVGLLISSSRLAYHKVNI